MLLWILTSIVLFLSFFYVLLWVVNPYRYRRVDLLPGPPKHWLKGTMHHTRKGSQNFKDHLVLTKKYGGLVRFVLFFYYYFFKQIVRILCHSMMNNSFV